MADVIYRYDGSFDGLLCCVFESYAAKEMPDAVLPPDAGQSSLYPEKWIVTDAARAARVAASIPQKISPEAARFVKEAFLTCLVEKELYILRFLRMGFRMGGTVLRHLTDDTVNTLFKAVKFLKNEAHLSLEFLRFAEYGNVLAAVIHPKNFVLPLLEHHFTSRFPRETFFIFDETHHVALVYHPYETQYLQVDSYSPPPPGEEERQYQELWKQFYNTIAIEGRINPKCRMTHMPKRYWPDMLEVAELTDAKRLHHRDAAIVLTGEKEKIEGQIQ